MQSTASTLDAPSLPRDVKICRHCGTLNNASDSLPGNGWIELVLWLCYIVPGLIYSIWRRTKKNAVCEACSSRDLVQIGTPVGAKLLAEHHAGLGVNNASPLTAPAKAKKAEAQIGPKWLSGWMLVAIVIAGFFAFAYVAGVINK